MESSNTADEHELGWEELPAFYDGVDIVCPICYGYFNNDSTIPTTLDNCDHLVCKQCLDQLRSLTPARGIGPTKIRCPVCKKSSRGTSSQKRNSAIALVNAVREIQALGKRHLAEREELSQMNVVLAKLCDGLSRSNTDSSNSRDPLAQFRQGHSQSSESDEPRQMVRCAEAATMHKDFIKITKPLPTQLPRTEVTVCLKSHLVRMVKYG